MTECSLCASSMLAGDGLCEHDITARLRYAPVPHPNPLTGEIGYLNPDGPEAADTIEFLRRLVTDLEQRLEVAERQWDDLVISARPA